jgi:hypothetical protein
VIIVHFGIGLMIGTISAVGCLLLGYSGLWSLFVYSAAGALGMLASVTTIYASPRLSNATNISPKDSKVDIR